MISPTSLAPSLADYLPRQRWFGAKDRTIELVRIRSTETLAEEGVWPAMLRVEAEVSLAGTDDARYQLFLGLRPTGMACEFLAGHEPAILGEFETAQGQALVYDALLDSELALALLRVVAPEYTAERVRPLGAEQSNTSLVYDDAMILKIFRRLTEGHNPEVEVIETLARVGFTSVPEPLASWRKGDFDLAFLQRFLAGATDGWNIALTSLRELFAEYTIGAAPPPGDALGAGAAAPLEATDPAEARGDFAGEAERIGEVTAEMHQALARGFGTHKVTGDDYAKVMEEQLEQVLGPGDAALADGARRIINRLRDIPDPGPAIRVHGDYHLAQVLRTDAGWFVLDFEGEPARPLEERTRPSSPLKDVAGMLRSLSYAPAVALSYQEDDLSNLGRAWEARNREAFMAGYLRKAVEAEPILPTDPAVRSAVLAAFELDKALYEVAYERANRPDWAHIPLGAVQRLTSEAARAV
ncbi:MAG TPA: phosphotransferase [Acidimicrobiia bacterium]|jgi:maltokinase|nr:phosphotransferase [Acidimicrobiia bacterium]